MFKKKLGGIIQVDGEEDTLDTAAVEEPVAAEAANAPVSEDVWDSDEEKAAKRELQEQEAYFQDLDLLDFLPEEYALTESGGILPQPQGQEENGFSTEEGDGNPDGIGGGEIKIEEVRIGEEVE